MEWFERFRAEFPAVQKQIYAEIALTNAVPDCVAAAVCSFLKRAGSGDNDKKLWEFDLMRIRGKIAQLINARPNEIAFTKNTAEGLNIISQGMNLEPGDNVVIIDQEHPNNLLPWLNLKYQGVEVRVAASRNHRLPIDCIWKEVDAQTRAVAVSSVQFCTGYRLDLPELGRRCREAGVKLVVDAIQSLGILQMDMGWGIDALACGGHKALLAPYGIGFLCCRESFLETLHPAYVGTSPQVKVDKKDAWQVHVIDRRNARQLELGTLNYPGIFGLEAGIDLLQTAGIGRIQRRVLFLSGRLNEGLRGLGYDVLSPESPDKQSGIVVAAVPVPEDFWRYLRAVGIRATLMDAGVVRFSLHAYNLEKEIDAILDAAAEYKRSISPRPF